MQQRFSVLQLRDLTQPNKLKKKKDSMCGTGIKREKEINETEQQPEIDPYTRGQQGCKSHSVEKE